LVVNGTMRMTDEVEANFWFCENHGNHTIFERQKNHYVLPQLGEKNSHAKKCKSWLHNYKEAQEKEEHKKKNEEKKTRKVKKREVGNEKSKEANKKQPGKK
jgi:hypothetical protein